VLQLISETTFAGADFAIRMTGSAAWISRAANHGALRQLATP